MMIVLLDRNKLLYNREITHFTDKPTDLQRDCIQGKKLIFPHVVVTKHYHSSTKNSWHIFHATTNTLNSFHPSSLAEIFYLLWIVLWTIQAEIIVLCLGCFGPDLEKQVLHCFIFSSTRLCIYFIGNSMRVSSLASLYLYPKCLTQSQKLNNYSLAWTRF